MVAAGVCRAVAGEQSDRVLATLDERTRSLPSGMTELLRPDAWRHPDITGGELPSGTETFRLLAAALAADDATLLAPAEGPDSHWSCWPEAGLP